MTHKVAIFTRRKRIPALLYYLDGLFKVLICIQFGKMFQLFSTGKSERMSIPDFHLALRQEPILYNEWIAALRLSTVPCSVHEIIDLVDQLLNTGRGVLESDK